MTECNVNALMCVSCMHTFKDHFSWCYCCMEKSCLEMLRNVSFSRNGHVWFLQACSWCDVSEEEAEECWERSSDWSSGAGRGGAAFTAMSKRRHFQGCRGEWDAAELRGDTPANAQRVIYRVLPAVSASSPPLLWRSATDARASSCESHIIAALFSMHMTEDIRSVHLHPHPHHHPPHPHRFRVHSLLGRYRRLTRGTVKHWAVLTLPQYFAVLKIF